MLKQESNCKIKKEKQLYIPIGISGSGKSYNRRMDCLIINRDEIRFMLLNYHQTGCDYDERIEGIIKHIEFKLFKLAIHKGFNIYLDATNLLVKKRMKYIKEAAQHGYLVHYVLYVDYTSARLLNKKRERIVPENVLERQIDQLEGITSREKQYIDSITIIK